MISDDRSEKKLGEKLREHLPNNFEHGEFCCILDCSIVKDGIAVVIDAIKSGTAVPFTRSHA